MRPYSWAISKPILGPVFSAILDSFGGCFRVLGLGFLRKQWRLVVNFLLRYLVFLRFFDFFDFFVTKAL